MSENKQLQQPENNAGGSGIQFQDYIKLILVRQPWPSVEVHFRVKYGTSMAKLKSYYAEGAGVNVNILRFLYDGKLISDEDTPTTLEMEDNDVIKVYHE
uniref:Ubiquitin-like domain-containing protein n=1 Tax=Panagrolaimus sp. JU765 TaxID=591449 RepID=A0AC34RID5_9BILA